MNRDIEQPSHYCFGQLEAREIIELAIADFRDPTTIYHVASALKYLLRASRKGGAADIGKARKHVVWAEQAARAHERLPNMGATTPKMGRFTQPPNCSLGVSEPPPSQTGVHEVEIADSLAANRESASAQSGTHPMAAEALRMADEQPCNQPSGESSWRVTWPGGASVWSLTQPGEVGN